MNDGRKRNGQFTDGNPGGPGRPRRTIEREYLATLGDSVSLDDWRAIIRKAVEQAKGGAPNAREWLSRHLLGSGRLIDLAAAEHNGDGPERDIERAAADRQQRHRLADLFANPQDSVQERMQHDLHRDGFLEGEANRLANSDSVATSRPK